MKVITEERLREIKESMPDGTSKLFMHTLIGMCKEIDTLTVSKLRPMCDAPRDGGLIMGVFVGSQSFVDMYYSVDSWRLPRSDSYFYDAHVDGWIPKPIYKPEKE